MKINIIEINKNLFDVNIEDKVETTHTIELDDTYHLKLTKGKLEKKQLILLSVQFLLTREPNTAILSSFELQLISTYFQNLKMKL